MRVRAALVAMALAGCGRIGFDAGSAAGGDARDGNEGGDGNGAADSSIAGANRAFISSSVHDGAFGGVAGADTFCQMRADEAGLVGTFGAFMWSFGVAPTARLGGSRGWIDTQGRALADDVAMWLTTRTYAPLELDEHGLPSPSIAWLGASGRDCNSWSSAAAGPMPPPYIQAGDGMVPPGSSLCDNTSTALICLERGKNVVVPPPSTVTGRRVFVTSATWTPGGGLASADSFCQGRADAANLSGTFVAFLATAGQRADQRFGDGAVFVRLDGIPLAPTALGFLDPATPATLSTFPTRIDSSIPQFLDTEISSWVGDATSNCGNWAVTSGSAATGFAYSADKMRARAPGNTSSCNTPHVLVCIEP